MRLAYGGLCHGHAGKGSSRAEYGQEAVHGIALAQLRSRIVSPRMQLAVDIDGHAVDCTGRDLYDAGSCADRAKAVDADGRQLVERTCAVDAYLTDVVQAKGVHVSVHVQGHGEHLPGCNSGNGDTFKSSECADDGRKLRSSAVDAQLSGVVAAPCMHDAEAVYGERMAQANGYHGHISARQRAPVGDILGHHRNNGVAGAQLTRVVFLAPGVHLAGRGDCREEIARSGG